MSRDDGTARRLPDRSSPADRADSQDLESGVSSRPPPAGPASASFTSTSYRASFVGGRQADLALKETENA